MQVKVAMNCVSLDGRLSKDFAEEPSSKKSSTSSEKWKEELKRLCKILMVVVLCFCAAIAHICMNLGDYYKVGKKDRKKDKHVHRRRYAVRGAWEVFHTLGGHPQKGGLTKVQRA